MEIFQDTHSDRVISGFGRDIGEKCFGWLWPDALPDSKFIHSSSNKKTYDVIHLSSLCYAIGQNDSNETDNNNQKR